MSLLPKIHREFVVTGDPSSLSQDMVSKLPRNGVTISQHYPGSRVCGTIRRLTSPSGGQVVRIDFHPIDGGKVEVVVESKFRFPGMDFAHENEKNIALIEDLIGQTSSGSIAA